MHTINVPIFNTWKHLIEEFQDEKKDRINEKVKEACMSMYVHIINEAIERQGGIDTRDITCTVTRKGNELIIKMPPIKAIIDLDHLG